MKEKNIEYGNQTIRSLKGADRVRKRPAVIFGSDGIEGCQHSFFEILSNSIDEAREGYGNIINVTVYNDYSILVEDFGRGVPLDWNEKEKRYNWELVFCELYAGGKYNNIFGGVYEFSLGLNGLGACATQYASEYMEVVSYQKGTKYSINFKKGKASGKLLKEDAPKSKTGTQIKWKPDLEVFTDIAVDKEYFKDILKKQAVVNQGLTLVLNWQAEDGSFEDYSFFYKKGIVDYINEIAGKDYLTPPIEFTTLRSGRDREDKDDYKVKIHMAFSFSEKLNKIEYYHNSSFLEHGGSPERATRTAFTYAIDKYAKDNGKYTKSESKIVFSDIEESLILIINSFSTQTSYANQTKKAITNVFITRAMTEFFRHSLEVYFAENPAHAEAICNLILTNKRARESSEKIRSTAKRKLSAPLDISNSVDKFVNCRTKDPDRAELYIVEGDSALTSVKLSRDSEFQAIIPVRGKTLNCLKASYSRILSNEIITDLIKVLGCGIEMKGGKQKKIPLFDKDALRWSKIIICTDADEDGYQIRTLILTMFYRLLPTLLREGYIYIAETPLFEITSKDKTFFAYDEKEKNEIVSKLGDAKYTIQRSKGLGQNEAEMMSETTMHPATRRLIRIVTDDNEEKTYELFDVLLGDNLAGRKQFIIDHGAKYLESADI